MKLLLTRIDESEKQTIGVLYILTDNGSIIADFDTLELPYLDNKRDVSCVPNGKYLCKKRKTSKFGEHLYLVDVPNRDYILIHRGNFYTDIKGCVLIGKDLSDINNDGYIDVIRSRDAMDELMYNIGSLNEIEIEIIG